MPKDNRQLQVRSGLGLGPRARRKVWRQLWDDKLLKDIGHGRFPNPDQGVREYYPRSVSIIRGIVQIGDSSGGKIPDDARIIRLPPSIVALTDNRVDDRIENPRFRATASFVEITRILFQNRWQDRASEERTDKDVSVGCAVALRITLRALPVCTPPVCCLINSRQGANRQKRDRIGSRLPGQSELLLRREGSGIGNIAHVEIRNEAENPLLYLFVKLLLCQLDLRQSDQHLRLLRGNNQHHQWHDVGFSRMHDSRDVLRREPFRTDRQLEGTRRGIGKGELSTVACQYLSALRLTFLREFHPRAADVSSGLINNSSANASRSLIELLPTTGGSLCLR